MASMTDYMEAQLDSFMEGSDLIVPAVWYAALYVDATTESGGGTEATYDGRQVVSFAAGTNDVQVLFTGLDADTYTHFAIHDALTGGNMWLHGPLSTPKTVPVAGNALLFEPGSIDVTFS